MKTEISYYPTDEHSVAMFLIIMILIFTAFSVIFLKLLFFSKLAGMRRKKRRNTYTPFIDQALLGILFEGRSAGEVLGDTGFRKLSRKRFFRLLLIENTIRLHESFAGDYQQKLEDFYTASGLHKDSFRKLRSLRWHIRCEGINELSRMRVKEAFPRIRSLSEAKNATVKQEALVGMIRLQGTEGLMEISSITSYINDWIQLNILSVVKNAGYREMPDFGRFLESANESVLVLGIRLAGTFGQAHHLPRIGEIMGSNNSRRIQMEGRKATAQLTFQTHSN